MMDMHCHIDLYPNHDEILNDIKSTGFYVLSVTTVPSAFEGTRNLTLGIKHCRTALGLHPQLAHQRKNELVIFDKLVSETRYIGEIGLDGSRGFKEHFDDQIKVFRHILKKCESYSDKILTIHSLNAVDDVLTCLHEYPNAGKPILHWFLATKRQVDTAVHLGCFFSIGPAMLYSDRAKKVISWLPKERVLLETDGPFAKVNGRILFPSDTDMIIPFLSAQWNLSTLEVTKQLGSNLKKLVT
ncbi:Qat anti-phage system TatD family nuclease QatD [Alteromonas macleodii]|uniref:Qat anti-phage system TatD family nuclease QatD n=1 Tax=Alteromonas macleodii TaxID=28108 RepID=UPI00207674AE|nr:Qat anti-phage system TatD family nuclease QatD [Alteromonas macleodii]USI29659.1 TatD family hydrolase [Alteromonas macleodii]